MIKDALLSFYASLFAFVILFLILAFAATPILLVICLAELFVNGWSSSFGQYAYLYFVSVSTISMCLSMILSYSIFRGMRELSHKNNFISQFTIKKNENPQSEKELLEELRRAKTFSECMKIYTGTSTPSDIEYLVLDRALELATTKEECWLVEHHASFYPDIVRQASRKEKELKSK
jgi:uncharacterized membrane protein